MKDRFTREKNVIMYLCMYIQEPRKDRRLKRQADNWDTDPRKGIAGASKVGGVWQFMEGEKKKVALPCS